MTGTHQTVAFSGFVRQRVRQPPTAAARRALWCCTPLHTQRVLTRAPAPQAEADMAFTEITKDYVVE